MPDAKPKRAFKGIWIPKKLWLDEKLTLQEKVFLAEIDSLDKGQGCYASNAYFAKFFGLSKKRVSFIINSLCQKKHIKSEIDTKAGNKRRLKLYPQKQGDPIPENRDTPIPQTGEKDNNTIEGIEDNRDFSPGDLSETNAKDEVYRLLLHYGVNQKVAKSIVFEKKTPPESIREAVKNGLSKAKYEKGFVLKPGYIIAALNAARKEGKMVKPTKNSKALKRELNCLNRHKNHVPLSQDEFGRRQRQEIAKIKSKKKSDKIPNTRDIKVTAVGN